jgi:hypothetical protein
MQLTIKKLRVILSFCLLIETRNFLPKVIQLSGLFLKPIPGFFKSVHAWVPATAGIVTTHALSGATTEVMSELGNQLEVKVNENFNYAFYTGRQRAQSFDISGLPNELNFQENIGSGSISGSVTQPGTYVIRITGYHLPNQSGSSTPPFSLTLTVNDSDENTEAQDVQATDKSTISYFTESSDLGNNWYQAWWGTFYTQTTDNWTFHSHLGWIFVHPIKQDTFWFYDNSLGWLFSSKDLYPYFYRNSSSSWLYHLANSSEKRFWSYSQEIELE